MVRQELVAKIRESCFGMVGDIEGHFYDEEQKMSVIGNISLKGNLTFVMFHLSKDFVIKTNYLELRNNIKSQIKNFLQA